MRRILPVALLSLLFLSGANAQQLPLFTQYVFDPYLINPSMVGSGNQAEVNALYRRQWTQITDGPKTAQLDIQLPINPKMAFGLNVYNDKSVLLNATSVLFTYGYKVLLAPDHRLGFGLSAGIFSNQINLNGVDPNDIKNDPALQNASLNNMAMNAQFGVNYSFKNLTLGFSLPNLIERKTFTVDNFQQVKFGALKNQIIFASYRFDISPGTWYLQPNFMYRLNEANLNYYEASAIVSYRNIVHLGGGYRQNFGPTAMVRLSVKQLSVGFAYDFPSNQAQVSTGGTQEIQIKYRFGRAIDPLSKKNAMAKAAEEQIPVAQEQVAEQQKPVVEEEKPVPATTTPVVVETATTPAPTEPAITPPVSVASTETTAKNSDNAVKQPVQSEVITPVVAPVQELVAKPAQPENYYFVVGTFESEGNARRFYNDARKKGLKVEIIESKPGKSPHYYYVHMPQHKAEEISLDKLLDLQKTTGYKEAWFTKVN